MFGFNVDCFNDCRFCFKINKVQDKAAKRTHLIITNYLIFELNYSNLISFKPMIIYLL